MEKWVKAEIAVLVCGHVSLFLAVILRIFPCWNSYLSHEDLSHNAEITQTYKIYKYIQIIYVSFEKLQCFATMMHLHCLDSDSDLIKSHFPQKTHFKSFNSILGNHRSAFQPINSFLHSEMSVTDEAQDNKGFLGVL